MPKRKIYIGGKALTYLLIQQISESIHIPGNKWSEHFQVTNSKRTDIERADNTTMLNMITREQHLTWVIFIVKLLTQS